MVTTTVPNTGTQATHNNRINKTITNSAPFTNCISEINNTQIYHDVVLPIYNLIEYSYNFSQTSGSLWQCFRDETAVDNNGTITAFSAAKTNSVLFKLN